MTMTFETYQDQARAEGFGEVLERRWPPHAVLEAHRHPFALKALVVQGEMWLVVEGRARHLHAGDTFEFERDVPHTERCGPDGATYWVARRT